MEKEKKREREKGRRRERGRERKREKEKESNTADATAPMIQLVRCVLHSQPCSHAVTNVARHQVRQLVLRSCSTASLRSLLAMSMPVLGFCPRCGAQMRGNHGGYCSARAKGNCFSIGSFSIRGEGMDVPAQQPNTTTSDQSIRW